VREAEERWWTSERERGHNVDARKRERDREEILSKREREREIERRYCQSKR